MGTRQAATSASTTSTHATRRPRSRHVGRIDGSVITVAPTQGPHPIRVGRPCPGYGTPASTRAARGRRPRGTAGRWRQRYHPRCGMPDPNSRYARWSSASPQPHPDQVATQERIGGNGQRERRDEQAPHSNHLGSAPRSSRPAIRSCTLAHRSSADARPRSAFALRRSDSATSCSAATASTRIVSTSVTATTGHHPDRAGSGTSGRPGP